MQLYRSEMQYLYYFLPIIIKNKIMQHLALIKLWRISIGGL